MRDKVFAIVGDVQSPEWPQGVNGVEGLRDVHVVRVFYFPDIKSGEVIKVNFTDYGASVPNGLNVLLLHKIGNTLTCGVGTLVLGPVRNFYPLKSLTDPTIEDIQVMFEAFRMEPISPKEQRLNDLLFEKRNRPLVVQYALDAKRIMADKAMEEYVNSLFSIVCTNDPLAFGTDTVIKADKMLLELTDPQNHDWKNTDRRRKIFEQLSKVVPMDSSNRKYVEGVLEGLPATK